MASCNLAELHKYLPLFATGFSQRIEDLVNQGVLKIDNKDLRVRSIGAIVIAAFGHVLLDANTKESDVDIYIYHLRKGFKF